MSRALVEASVLRSRERPTCVCGCGRPRRSNRRFATRTCWAGTRRGIERERGEGRRPAASRDTLLPGLVRILEYLRWPNRRLEVRLGRSTGTVHHWLLAKGGMHLARFLQVCRILHATPDELTGYAPLPPERLEAIRAAVAADEASP